MWIPEIWKKTLEEHDQVELKDEDLNETQPLKTSNLQDVNAPQDGFLLTVMPLVNGGAYLTVVGPLVSLAAMQAYNRLATMAPINQYLITKSETYTEFVMPVTIVGIPSTINITIGTKPQSSLTRLVHKLKRRKP